MAQDAVNAVVEALSRGMQNVRAIQQSNLDRAERSREFDAQRAAADKLFELQQAQFDSQKQQLDIARKHQEFEDVLQGMPAGVVPPGYQQLPAIQPTPDQPLVQSGLEKNTIITPSGMAMQTPTPQALTQLEAERNRLINLPKYQQELDMLHQKQAFDLNMALGDREAQSKRLEQQFGYQKELENLRLTNQKVIDDANNKTRMDIAKMNQAGVFGNIFGTGGTMTTDEDGNVTLNKGSSTDLGNQVLNDIQAGLQGKLSAEQIKAKYGNQKARDMVNLWMGNAGGRFLTEKQIDQFKTIDEVSKMLPALNSMYDAINNPWKRFALHSPISDASNEFKVNKEIVEKSVPTVVKFLTTFTRYNTQEAEKIAKGLVPDYSYLFSNPEAETKKRDQFVVHDIQDAVKNAIGRLPPQQQTIFRNNWNLPDLSNAISAPGTEHPQPAGTTKPGTKFNVPAGSMLVREKKSGRMGYENKAYIKAHPELYEIIVNPEDK